MPFASQFNKLLFGVIAFTVMLLTTPQAQAGWSNPDSTMNFRVRFQARLDAGDTITSDDGRAYANGTDLYFRRVRLEIRGKPIRRMNYTVIFTADQWHKNLRDKRIGMSICYLNFRWHRHFNTVFGLTKLPYSRQLITSYSRMLFVERPYMTDKASDYINGYIPFNIQAYGAFADSSLVYSVALMEGFQHGDDWEDAIVQSGQFSWVVRFEVAPPGWTETRRKRGSHRGEGQHLVLGFGYAAQQNIQFQTDTNGFRRPAEDHTVHQLDLSFHRSGLTLQAEYLNMLTHSTTDRNPMGWYAQGGFIFEKWQIEPALKYEFFDEDTYSPDGTTESWVFGLNYYIRKHDLKIQANYLITRYDPATEFVLPDDDDARVFQLQAQLYF